MTSETLRVSEVILTPLLRVLILSTRSVFGFLLPDHVYELSYTT